MTARHRPRRAALRAALAGSALLATGLVLAPAPAPVGADAVGWNLTIDAHPAVATERPVVVSGTVFFVGTVTSVRVRLVPVGLPEACGEEPIVQSVTPSRGRYRADDLRPPCNGPHRIEVVASGTLLGQPASSGAPERGEVALADPGTAPAPPSVDASGGVVVVRWPAAASPDVVGWTVVPDGGAPVDVSGTSWSAAVAPGSHGYRLVARRWGAEGPEGEGQLRSPASPAATVTVAAEQAEPPTPPSVPGGPVGGPKAGGGVAPPARRPGATSPARRPSSGATPTTVDGYRDDLPYGAPDEAFQPGDDPEPDGEQAAAGTSPSARVVRSSERTAPGLVAPFALALLLVTVAAHLSAYLRRSARAAGGDIGPG